MERLIKCQRDGRYHEIVPRGRMRFLDFARLQLAKGERHSHTTDGRESVLDVFSGTALLTLTNTSGKKHTFGNVGGRETSSLPRPSWSMFRRKQPARLWLSLAHWTSEYSLRRPEAKQSRPCSRDQQW